MISFTYSGLRRHLVFTFVKKPFRNLASRGSKRGAKLVSEAANGNSECHDQPSNASDLDRMRLPRQEDIIINSSKRVAEFMKLLDGLLEENFWLPSEALLNVLDSNSGGRTVLGRGVTSDVVALWFTPSSKIVARKSLEELEGSDSIALKELRNHLLVRGYSNLLQILGAQLIENLSITPPYIRLRLDILSEFAALGNLFSFIPLAQYVLKIFQLPEEFLLKMGAHLLKAVSQLHSLGLVHRDIKPENFLLFVNDDDLIQLKLADFGLCIGAEELRCYEKRVVNLCGTAGYASPEQFWAGRHKISSASDVYSLGVIMCKLLAHEEDRFVQRQIHLSRWETIHAMFPPQKACNIVRQLNNQECVPCRYESSTKIGDLLNRMMSEEPTRRPTASEAYEELVAFLPGNSTTISLNEFMGEMTALLEAAFHRNQAVYQFALSMMEKFHRGLRLHSRTRHVSM